MRVVGEAQALDGRRRVSHKDGNEFTGCSRERGSGAELVALLERVWQGAGLRLEKTFLLMDKVDMEPLWVGSSVRGLRPCLGW